MKTKFNHEMWHTCQRCGYVYDYRLYGKDCPKCSELKTVEDYHRKITKKNIINIQ